MFNVGGGEVLVILLVALLVLGPAKLPDAARQIGAAMTQLRRMSAGFQNELKSAMDTTPEPQPRPPAASATASAAEDPDAAVEPTDGDGAVGGRDVEDDDADADEG